MRCKTCHYWLNGLTEDRCPECGRVFDPNDPSTVDASRMSPAVRATIRIVIGIVFLIGLLAGIGAIYVYYSFSSAFRNYRP